MLWHGNYDQRNVGKVSSNAIVIQDVNGDKVGILFYELYLHDFVKFKEDDTYQKVVLQHELRIYYLRRVVRNKSFEQLSKIVIKSSRIVKVYQEQLVSFYLNFLKIKVPHLVYTLLELCIKSKTCFHMLVKHDWKIFFFRFVCKCKKLEVVNNSYCPSKVKEVTRGSLFPMQTY